MGVAATLAPKGLRPQDPTKKLTLREELLGQLLSQKKFSKIWVLKLWNFVEMTFKFLYPIPWMLEYEIVSHFFNLLAIFRIISCNFRQLTVRHYFKLLSKDLPLIKK